MTIPQCQPAERFLLNLNNKPSTEKPSPEKAGPEAIAERIKTIEILDTGFSQRLEQLGIQKSHKFDLAFLNKYVKKSNWNWLNLVTRLDSREKATEIDNMAAKFFDEAKFFITLLDEDDTEYFQYFTKIEPHVKENFNFVLMTSTQFDIPYELSVDIEISELTQEHLIETKRINSKIFFDDDSAYNSSNDHIYAFVENKFENMIWLNAYANDQIVAMSVAVIENGYCYICDVATTLDYRKKGIASALISEIAKIAQEKACTKLFLHAELSANSLYETLGFENVMLVTNHCFQAKKPA